MAEGLHPERENGHYVYCYYDPELVCLRDEAASKSAGAACFLRKRLEDRLARRIECIQAEAAGDAHVRLSAVAPRTVLLRPLSSATGGDDLVPNAAFLVTQQQLARLPEQAQQIVSERPWLRCKSTGPWPPYNFV